MKTDKAKTGALAPVLRPTTKPPGLIKLGAADAIKQVPLATVKPKPTDSK